MPRLSLPVNTLIRENISVLMTFAFSRPQLQKWAEDFLLGEFKHLRQTVFTMAEQRAEKACLELAIFLRYLDDEENVSSHFAKEADFGFGTLHQKDGATSDLKLRDVANKIIHAVAFEWDFSRPHQPMLVCIPRDPEQWSKASVNVINVSVACGSLAG